MLKSKTNIKGKLWTLLFIPLAVAAVLQLFVANRVAGEGKKLSRIDQQIEKIKKENNILREETARARSLQKIEKASIELGFSKPTSVVYVDLPADQAEKTAQIGVLPNTGELGQ